MEKFLTVFITFFSLNDSNTRGVSLAIGIITSFIFLLCVGMVAVTLHLSPEIDKLAREYFLVFPLVKISAKKWFFLRHLQCIFRNNITLMDSSIHTRLLLTKTSIRYEILIYEFKIIALNTW